MKRRTRSAVLLAILVVLALTACQTASAAVAEEETMAIAAPEPITITVPDPKKASGTLHVYQDDQIIYEYSGPMDVVRKSGQEYEITVRTELCSCFQEEIEMEVGSDDDTETN